MIGPNDPTAPIPETEIRVPPFSSEERTQFIGLLKTLVSDMNALKMQVQSMDRWMRGDNAAGGVFDTQRRHDAEIKDVRRVVVEHIEDHRQHNTANWDWIKAGLLGAVGILVMVILWLVAEGHAS